MLLSSSIGVRLHNTRVRLYVATSLSRERGRRSTLVISPKRATPRVHGSFRAAVVTVRRGAGCKGHRRRNVTVVNDTAADSSRICQGAVICDHENHHGWVRDLEVGLNQYKLEMESG